MIRENFLDELLSMLRSEQMETGEFGLSRNIDVVNVVSPYHKAFVQGKKANSFVTMYSIELLSKMDTDADKIQKAISWFHSKISKDGYFQSEISISEQVEDIVTGQLISVPSTIKIFRHTAEALSSLFLVEGITPISIQMLDNLLSAQNVDGGWSASSNNRNSQLLATSFTLKAITAIDSTTLSKGGYALFEQEGKKNSIDTATSKALMWLAKISNESGGLWHLGMEKEEDKAFYTGIILGMTPRLFAGNYPELTKSLIKQLIMCSSNGLWMRKNTVDIDGSARILAALVKLKKFFNFDYDFNAAFLTLQRHIESNESKLDPATLCFALDSLYEYNILTKDGTSKNANAVVSIYCEEKHLGSGFVARVKNSFFCITCKHIFKSAITNKCKIVFCNGDSIDCFVSFLDESKHIHKNTMAKNDIGVIYLNISNENIMALFFAMNNVICGDIGGNADIVSDRYIATNYYWYGTEKNEPLYDAIIKLVGKPVLTVVLNVSAETLQKRLLLRNYNSESDRQKELDKLQHSESFVEKTGKFLARKDFNYIIVNNEGKSVAEVVDEIISKFHSIIRLSS